MSAAPDHVRAWAHERSQARAARDWTEADRLRTEIEAAGWRIVDRGTDFSLEPIHPPDVVEDGRARYGSSASVPSRLAEPDSAVATVVLLAADQPADLARTLAALRAFAPANTEVVLVADGASPDQEAALLAPDGPAAAEIGGRPVEIAWTSQPLGYAAALNIGLHRASGRIVILLDTSIEPTGDLVSQLVQALDDRSVAVAGPWGITSDDLRRFVEAPPGMSTRSRPMPWPSGGPTCSIGASSTSASGSIGTSTSGGAWSCATRASDRASAAGRPDRRSGRRPA